MLHLSDFNFHLPPELLAEHPVSQRDESRLMVLNRKDQSIQHFLFKDITRFFETGDCLILNNTQVIPARMKVRKNRMNGARIELLLIEEINAQQKIWNVLLDPMKKLKLGDELVFGNSQLRATILKEAGERERHIQFQYSGNSEQLKAELFALGEMPLPRYIKRSGAESDKTRYQTVYASQPGAVAAPTAGLHFTPELIGALKNKGILFPEVTLQIGIGTFNPIHREDFWNHQMHTESFEVSEAAAITINNCLNDQKRVCAVGTTVLRTLESTIKQTGQIKAFKNSTNLFIYPPHDFRSVNCLLTNFHTPMSSLLMLVSAFAGYDFLMEAYRIAVKEQYRFYSYGDAMLIL
jgi:S-adenosylmethionine:tRNA ribosyltransferase-isomerase